jgi:uncharacterized membrane protein
MSPIPGIPVEAAVIEGVQWLRLGIDTSVRLSLARYLALALELQLGADILSTAVAPSWDQIGKLGAIAAIRTSLNFFLMRELQEAGEMPSARAER